VVPSGEYLSYQTVKNLRTEPRGVEAPYSITFCFTFGRVLSFPSKAIVDVMWTVALSSQFAVYSRHITYFNRLKCALNISGILEWCSKTTCIHKPFQKVQCLTNLPPVYILIHFAYLDLDQGILLKQAANLPALFVQDESFHFISFHLI